MYTLQAADEIETGFGLLHAAFQKKTRQLVSKSQVISEAGSGANAVILIDRGEIFRSSLLPLGRRTICEILMPGDFYGFGGLAFAHEPTTLTASASTSYQSVSIRDIRKLIHAEPSVHLAITAWLAQMRVRSDRHAASCRLDARERVAAMLIEFYDRLHDRKLITIDQFHLALTQEEIGDYLSLTMVHINRTLRRLREEGLLIVDRHMMVLRDVSGLRALAEGLPSVH